MRIYVMEWFETKIVYEIEIDVNFNIKCIIQIEVR